jgi:hypothetical protein
MFGINAGSADIVIPALYRNELFQSGQAVDLSISRRKENIPNAGSLPLMHAMLMRITGDAFNRPYFPEFGPSITRHLHAYKSDHSAKETFDDLFMITCVPTTIIVSPHPRIRREFREIAKPGERIESGHAIRDILDIYLHDLHINIWAANQPIRNKPRSYVIDSALLG